MPASREAWRGQMRRSTRPQNPNFDRREGAFTAGLFNQKSLIASPRPLKSSSGSFTLKQTDTVVSACHIGDKRGGLREHGQRQWASQGYSVRAMR